MAFQNKIIRNSKTGQDIRFLQTAKETNGELLEMESTFSEYSKEPAPHYHPYQEENFTVLSGELTIRMNGELKVLKQGESIHIPRNKAHSMWNNSPVKTVVNWKVQPAMNTDQLLETATGLANNGKTNNNGMPNILQVALMANKFSDVFRLASPPFALQKIVFSILSPLAYVCGYRSSYKEYID